MKTIINKCIFFSLFGLLLFSAEVGYAQGVRRSPRTVSEPIEVPGTIEQQDYTAYEQIEVARAAAVPSKEEFAIYYYRPDGNYDEWGVWLWAFGVGDGADNWPYTQHLQVVNDVGYLKVRLDGSDIGAPIVGNGNRIGFILRQDSDWIKDGAEDRIWDIEQFGNEAVVISGSTRSHPAGKYTPYFRAASLEDAQTVRLSLSGRHALSIEPDASGFMVSSPSCPQLDYSVTDARNPRDRGNRNRNYTRTIHLLLDKEVTIRCPLEVQHNQYRNRIAVSDIQLQLDYAESHTPSADYKLGALYDNTNNSTDFRLWAPTADVVTLRLFQQSQQQVPSRTIELAKNESIGVWSTVITDTDLNGWFYEYEVTIGASPQIVLDPYAISMDVYRGSGVGRGAIVDIEQGKPQGGWEGYTDVHLPAREDAIIYEIHVRDFTIDPNLDTTAPPGTFLAFIERLPYLKELGVTHIQLLPVLNFLHTDESNRGYEANGTASNNNYNWGYDPHNYFTPEGWYATDATDPYARIVELKTLIKEIHRHGMGVLLDVVYNHMGNTFLLENIVPHYYFRKNADGSYTNNSGVGNDTASTRAMMRKLIVDSVYHWVSEYHIDGFRFDLMGLIDTETILRARERVAVLPDKSDILFEGEGWEMYNGPRTTTGMDQDYMTNTNLVTVFNDEIRDALKGGGFAETKKGLLTDSPSINTKQIYENLHGNPLVNYSADDPGDSMLYIAAHDGLTLYDNISHNLGLSPAEEADHAEILRRAGLGNFLILTGQGIAFLHGGQERGRSKPAFNARSEVIGRFVRNSYDSSDNINQIIWQTDSYQQRLLNYTAGLIAIRRQYELFRMRTALDIRRNTTYIAGENASGLGWQICYGGQQATVLMNASDVSQSYSLPQKLRYDALVLVDGYRADVNGIANPQGVTLTGRETRVRGERNIGADTVTLEPLTATIIVERECAK